MAFLSKIYIIACLLLNFLMCQIQEYPHPHSHPSMPKHPRNSVLGEPLDFGHWQPTQYRDTPMAICPAEHPSDVSFEKSPAPKVAIRKKVVKNEDDDEDLDMAAGDDDGDDNKVCGAAMIVDKEAFVARLSCLMRKLQHHTQTIASNLKKIESQLGGKLKQPAKETSKNKMIGSKPPPKPKGRKNMNNMQEQKGDPQDSHPDSAGQKHNTGPQSQSRRDTPLPGSESESESLLWVPRQEALKTIFQVPDDQGHQRYEEYEAKLRHLMANRDAIERNVMKMLGPRM